MKVIYIDVNQAIIDDSVAKLETRSAYPSLHCPIAVAVTKRLAPGMFARVGGTTVTINIGDPEVSGNCICNIDLPYEATDFVREFDGRSNLSTPMPIQFPIVIDESLLRQ